MTLVAQKSQCLVQSGYYFQQTTLILTVCLHVRYLCSMNESSFDSIRLPSVFAVDNLL